MLQPICFLHCPRETIAFSFNFYLSIFADFCFLCGLLLVGTDVVIESPIDLCYCLIGGLAGSGLFIACAPLCTLPAPVPGGISLSLWLSQVKKNDK